MSPLAGSHLFLLGLASGVALLAITGLRHVSPGWVKVLLAACGLLVICRYVAAALFAMADAPESVWAWRHAWFAGPIGLSILSVFAVDQLIRHPAVSPKKLLVWMAPFLVAYGTLMLVADATPVVDHLLGWSPQLDPAWQVAASVVHGLFVLLYVAVCALLIRKVPSRPIRFALLGLALGQAYVGVDGLMAVLGKGSAQPFLYSEMLTLLAVWHAGETSQSVHGA